MNDIVKKMSPEKGILHISLNRPEQLNALSRDVLSALSSLFDEAKHDPEVKAVLLSGEGKAFCAGADIKQLVPLVNIQEGDEFARYGQVIFNQLESLGKPSLAAIQGYAFGGGCELAMSATMRIAANTAQFSQPEIKLGVIPGFGGTQRLSRLIGKGRALEICLTGRRFSAAEALQWGFVSELTIPEELIARAVAILKELVKLSPNAMRSIIHAINEGYNLPLAEGLRLEAQQFGVCCASKDKQEGVNAFLEKRAPVFSGK